MQLGPDTCTRPEGQQTNTLATRAQCQYKQPRATVLAGVRIAHHRPGSVINLALLTESGLDDHTSFRRYRSAQLTYETLDALVAAREPVRIDQVLEDTHRVATPRQLQLDRLAVCFADTRRSLASLFRRRFCQQKAGGHLYGRF